MYQGETLRKVMYTTVQLDTVRILQGRVRPNGGHFSSIASAWGGTGPYVCRRNETSIDAAATERDDSDILYDCAN